MTVERLALVRRDPPAISADFTHGRTRADAQAQLLVQAIELADCGHETLAAMLMLIIDASRRCQAVELYGAMLAWRDGWGR